MSYASDSLAWGDGTYRPAHGVNSSSGWPTPPAVGSFGPAWVSWLDDNAGSVAPNGYRVWFDDPNNSGGGGGSNPPPRPPKKN